MAVRTRRQQREQKRQQENASPPPASERDEEAATPTSSIPTMTVAEVRRHLDFLRSQWHDRRNCPFFLTDELSNGTSYQDFAFAFVRGQHEKRHRRSRRRDARAETTTTAGGEE